MKQIASLTLLTLCVLALCSCTTTVTDGPTVPAADAETIVPSE